jgi:hypothetical protein
MRCLQINYELTYTIFGQHKNLVIPQFILTVNFKFVYQPKNIII